MKSPMELALESFLDAKAGFFRDVDAMPGELLVRCDRVDPNQELFDWIEEELD